MRNHPTLISIAVALAVATTIGCSGDAGDEVDTTPVSVTYENLEGYWAGIDPGSSPTSASVAYEPFVLHIRRGIYAGEPPWISELMFPAGATEPGEAQLEGDVLRHFVEGGASTARFVISELTSETMTVVSHRGGEPFELRRQDGCAAPGSYVVAPGQAVAAAYGPDGSLHVIPSTGLLNEDTSSNHLYRYPGDCGFRGSGLGGIAVDVADDGTARFIRFVEGDRTLSYLEATPETGGYQATSETVVTDDPFGRVGALAKAPDGEPIVLLARGGETRAYHRDGSGWTDVEIPATRSGTINPLVLDVQYDAEGNVYVRQERTSEIARFDGESWESWDPQLPEGHPVAFAYDWASDGTLVAAFTRPARPGLDITVFGEFDGVDWTLRDVGVGVPWAMRVDDGATTGDERIEIAVAHAPEERRIMSVISFDRRGDDVPQQLLVQPDAGTQPITLHDSVWKFYPVVAFGPPGQSYVSSRAGGYRNLRKEVGDIQATHTTELVFLDDAEATVRIPRIGAECTESCVVEIPWNELVSVYLSAENGQAQLTGSSDFYLDGTRWERLDENWWSILAFRPFGDPTFPAEGTIGVTVTENRVATAVELPSGLEPHEGANPIALAQFPDGALLTVVSSGQGLHVARRDPSTGEALAEFDACALQPGQPTAAATEAGAALVVRSSAECEEVVGDPSETFAVWLDDELRVIASEPVARDTIRAFLPTGEAALLSEEFDPETSQQWVELTLIAPDGTRSSAELDRTMARERLWGVPGGLILEDDHTFAAYDVDGTERWSLTWSTINESDPALRAVDVYENQFVLAFGMARGLTVAGRTPERDGEVPTAATWILTIDVETGAIAEDVLVPAYTVGELGAVVPLEAGDFGLFDHPERRANYALADDGVLIEHRTYANDPPGSCLRDGCPARRTFAVPHGAGAWVMFPAAPGTVAYDGPTFQPTAHRAHLTYWDPTGAR